MLSSQVCSCPSVRGNTRSVHISVCFSSNAEFQHSWTVSSEFSFSGFNPLVFCNFGWFRHQPFPTAFEILFNILTSGSFKPTGDIPFILLLVFSLCLKVGICDRTETLQLRDVS